jgi:DNA-binding NarL/FixJ family response regulator
MDSALSILLVEPNGARRMRLAAVISREPRLLLAESQACGRRALERVALVRPDVVLVAAALEAPSAAEFVRRAKAGATPPYVVAIVSAGEEQAAVDWLADGAEGCVSEAAGSAELAASLLQLRAGAAPLVPAVAWRVVEKLRALPRAAARPQAEKFALTTREAEVLQMLAAGCSYQQASERLGISLHTVSSHVKSAYRKLDVHSAGAAVMRAVALRIISVHEEGTQNHGVAAATPAA